MDGHTDGKTDGQCENSIPPSNIICESIKNIFSLYHVYSCLFPVEMPVFLYDLADTVQDSSVWLPCPCPGRDLPGHSDNKSIPKFKTHNFLFKQYVSNDGGIASADMLSDTDFLCKHLIFYQK